MGRAGVKGGPRLEIAVRLELSPSPPRRRGRDSDRRRRGPATEAAAFEKEFPGASWLSAQVFRSLEVVGGHAEALIASVARRHGLSHAALNALAVIEGNGAPMTRGPRVRHDVWLLLAAAGRVDQLRRRRPFVNGNRRDSR